jgi:alkanesulfonate monooxygenase SsuD/methylene tetrahydromethanopterin reductase-like flavin-dependent oxidoreductase (luciferase family)
LKIGIKTGQGGYTYDELSKMWQKAEELRFDSAWLYDHFIALGNPNTPCLEAYSTLGALARDTKHIRIGVMVTCVAYRNPAYLAKISSTLDVISNGRLIMALGAGWYEDEYKSYDYKFLQARERISQLRETIKILRMMWREQSPSFEGKHFSIHNAVNLPKPVQKDPPIWVGIREGTKILPAVAVKEADGLNTMSQLEVCKRIINRAESIRNQIGRKRSNVTYSLQIYLMTGTESQLDKIAEHSAKRSGMSKEEYLKRIKGRGCVIGSPEECAAVLRNYVEAGIDYLVPIIVGDTLLFPLETLKDKILPLI